MFSPGRLRVALAPLLSLPPPFVKEGDKGGEYITSTAGKRHRDVYPEPASRYNICICLSGRRKRPADDAAFLSPGLGRATTLSGGDKPAFQLRRGNIQYFPRAVCQ